MKIKTKDPIVDLSGKETKGEDGKIFTIGRAISDILLAAKEGGKMKLFVMAQKFHTEKEVELDNADLELIKKSVETSSVYNNLVTGQILVGLSKLKEDSK